MYKVFILWLEILMIVSLNDAATRKKSIMQTDISHNSILSSGAKSENHKPPQLGNFSSLMNLHKILQYEYPLPKQSPRLLKEYDFIVVGAGSAGSVIASRLSENPKWTVLLLEPGDGESLLTDIPLFSPLILDSDYNWYYKSEKGSGMCQAFEDERCVFMRGKGIGGSSIINSMVYSRGADKDWDDIIKAGNPGWSFSEVLPYFLKSEKARLLGLENSPYHNKYGLMSIEYIPYRTLLARQFINAGIEMGYKIMDYNQGNKFGFSYLQIQTLNGRRHSVSKAFLYPFRNRPNLHILPLSIVTKINIDPITKVAESVNYKQNQMDYTIPATKEIILSAGTLISPQLLMLSGVGPKDHLESLGIKVIKDARVGDNMRDHPYFFGLNFLINNPKVGLRRDDVNFGSFLQYYGRGTGVLSMPGGLEAISFFKSNISEKYPDIEITFASASIASDETGNHYRTYRLKHDFFNDVYGSIKGKSAYTLNLYLLNSKSIGNIRLRDINPDHQPIITFNLHPDDVELLIKGIKYAIRISKTKSMKKYGSKLHNVPFPGCIDFMFGSNDYWRCAIKYMTIPGQHHTGTCKMGSISDPTAVVDNRLRVHGVKNLRVGDLSIIPTATSSHTNAPAVMIGEKLSDMIKQDWKIK